MIPEAKNAAVARALRETFGVTECEDISTLTRGLAMALIFRIVVRGSPYLLRISTRSDAMYDPTPQITSLKAAAEAGLAPHVWFTSSEDRISITDFVEPVPFPVAGALVLMPTVLRALHALPPFPKALNYATMNKGFIRRFQAANIFPQRRNRGSFRPVRASGRRLPPS
ncbi:MAG TPA: hypothetical protein VFE61_22200 [Candidatus Sulfotelmatobacter sp.]|jgi:hypothetical protein|nr:hypothetical protein [Candidatus Sulfotelmatobacter sp.]